MTGRELELASDRVRADKETARTTDKSLPEAEWEGFLPLSEPGFFRGRG